MSEQKYYFVYIQPKFIEYNAQLKSLISKNDGSICCTSIDHLSFYLALSVSYEDLISKSKKSLSLLIPHSQVLYVLNIDGKYPNKTLGFCSTEE